MLLITTLPSINLKAILSHISMNLTVFHLSKHLLNFLSDLYIPPWLGKIFKFMVFRFLENAIAGQKIESNHFNFFYSCLLSKTLPHYHHPGRGKLLWELQKWTKLNLWGYCSHVLINPIIFAPLTFIFSCFTLL